jgi:hypothetical protein
MRNKNLTKNNMSQNIKKRLFDLCFELLRANEITAGI